MIKSKYKLLRFEIPIIIILIPAGLYRGITGSPTSRDSLAPEFYIYFALPLFIIAWIWLVFGELRTKALSVTIEDNSITVKNYFGFGNTKRFDFEDFEGFKTSELQGIPLFGKRYEYLYLIKANKKVIKISEYYHRNYSDLKQIIASKSINLGFEKFSSNDELVEIFKSRN